MIFGSSASLLGHICHQPPRVILGSLPDPPARDQPPSPLVIPDDTGWEDSEIRTTHHQPGPEPLSESNCHDEGFPPFSVVPHKSSGG